MNRRKILLVVRYFIKVSLIMLAFLFTGCNVNIADSKSDVNLSKQDENHSALSDFKENKENEDQKPVKEASLELKYAKQYSLDYYSKGYMHIRIKGDRDYIFVPENMPDDDLGIKDAVYIHAPCDNIYLAASSAVDLFASINALDTIKAISVKADDLSISEAVSMIENGDIIYVGKYSGPDYESILNRGCTLAIESTMINHSPKIKEELEDFDIPVITEHSSYEEDPLGRLEWIKLYGALTGREDEAKDFFDKEEAAVNSVISAIQNDTGSGTDPKSVAFFYISSNGYVNVRKPGDYFCKMIEIAGGSYALNDLVPDEENALSTMNIGWEDFYLMAVDADILIYNGTIDDSVKSLEALLSMNELFADFKAVKEGEVYCTNRNVYQESSSVGEIITELYEIIGEEGSQKEEFFFTLK